MLAAQDPVGQWELDLGILTVGRERASASGGGLCSKKKQQWVARWQGAGPEDTHVELLDGGAAALVGSDHLHLHDLDGVGTGTVASTHVTVCGRGVNFIEKLPLNHRRKHRGGGVNLDVSCGSISY